MTELAAAQEHALHRAVTHGVHGTVTVRDHFWPAPDGRQCTGVTGRITVHQAAAVLGFDVSARDANWLVQIDGENDTVVLPGCAVLGFHLHAGAGGDTYFEVP